MQPKKRGTGTRGGKKQEMPIWPIEDFPETITVTFLGECGSTCRAFVIRYLKNKDIS